MKLYSIRTDLITCLNPSLAQKTTFQRYAAALTDFYHQAQVKKSDEPVWIKTARRGRNKTNYKHNCEDPKKAQQPTKDALIFRTFSTDPEHDPGQTMSD